MTVILNWSCDIENMENDVERWIPMLEQLLRIVANKEMLSGGEVSLTFVDDDTIRLLNHQYRNIDEATDVLSFPLVEDGEERTVELEQDTDSSLPILWGDIIISVPTAKRQSDQFGHSMEREIGFLFVHGFLHLLGYDHLDDESEREMFRIQEEVLSEAGLTR